MFQIFNKKKFLIDYLGGFLDIHNHILPGIDDGAKNVEESMEILKAFAELGITNFVTTPHIMYDYYPNTPKTINSALENLKAQLNQSGMNNIAIETAAEHMIDSNFEVLLESENIMPLKKDYMLVEMSYLQPSLNFENAIKKIASKGYFPILAHPERYLFLGNNQNKYAHYKKMGILFQMNLLSLGGFYGNEVKKNALKLLENGQIDILGSDVHNLGHIKALNEIRISDKLTGIIKPIIESSWLRFQ